MNSDFVQDVERDRLKAMVKLVWSGRVNEAGAGAPGRIHGSLPCWDQVAVDKAFENMAKEPLMELGPWISLDGVARRAFCYRKYRMS